MSRSTLSHLLELIENDLLVSANLSNPKVKEKDTPTKIGIRAVSIKDKLVYQVSSHLGKQVRHANLTGQELSHLVKKMMETVYAQGMFSTKEGDFHLLVNKRKEMTVLKKKGELPPPLTMHNREKKYVLKEGIPIPFLIELGIMTKEGKIIAKKYDKFRQINRFLEMVKDTVPVLRKNREESYCFNMVDFGCGKAYLTFALYHYLSEIEKLNVNILGLDLKEDVIAFCQGLANRLGYQTLTFAVGDINDHQPKGKIDLVFSLHACDTATDAALEKAIRWDAEVILCVPCCQHELYGQVDSNPLSTLLRHGILKERFAALVTDAVRAEILSMVGYEVQILEFIDLEHTPKNLLIRAVKNPSSKAGDNASQRCHLFMESLNIRPTLWQKISPLTPS